MEALQHFIWVHGGGTALFQLHQWRHAAIHTFLYVDKV